MNKKYLLIFTFLYLRLAIFDAQVTKIMDFNRFGYVYLNPMGALTVTSTKIYGMAQAGGVHLNGSIFSLNLTGTGYIEIFNFDSLNGRYPQGALTLAANDTILFGMTPKGGSKNYGVIFSININGKDFKDLHYFDSIHGKVPGGSLILSGNILYGMTSSGGAYNYGSIFSMNVDGSGYTDLFDFNGKNGNGPQGSLTLSGNILYGMTQLGGANGYGNIFSINKNGTGFKDLFDLGNQQTPYGDLTISGNKMFGIGFYSVFSINLDGTGYKDVLPLSPNKIGSPFGSLTLSGKVLYGMSRLGGATSSGNIFSVDTDGTRFTDMYDLSTAAGCYPIGSLTRSGALIYGMTNLGGPNDCGIVFSIDTNGTGFANLYSLNNGLSGAGPYESLAISNNVIYGVTGTGGHGGLGNIFSINIDGTGYRDLQECNSTGSSPSGLVVSGNVIYGVKRAGGANNYGSIFSMNTDGTGYKILMDCNGSNGIAPDGPLVLSGDTLYGITNQGGVYYPDVYTYGTVFSIKTDGTGYRDLHDFGFNQNPSGSLLLSGNVLYGTGGTANTHGVFSIHTDGTGYKVLSTAVSGPVCGPLAILNNVLYGSTEYGGNDNSGNIYSINTDGTGLTDLHDFGGGAFPLGGLTPVKRGGKDKLYGTTSQASLFSINPDGTGYEDLFDFSLAFGNYPNSVLSLLGGTLYGTAGGGGKGSGGILFKYDTPSALLESKPSICVGNLDTLRATGAKSYTWTPSSGLTLINDSVVVVFPSVTSAYTVTCSAYTDSNIVIVDTLPLIKITTSNPAICSGDSISLNGNPGMTYSWSTGATFQTIYVKAANTYSLTVANSYGCKSTSTISVPVIPSPTAAISSISDSICAGSSDTLHAVGMGKYYWSTSDTAQTIVNKPFNTTTYTLTVTSSNGCTATAEKTMIFYSIKGAPISAIGNTTFCQGDSVTLIGTSGFSSYNWSSGQNTDTITAKSIGTYTLTVLNNKGCAGTSTQTVTVDTLPAPPSSVVWNGAELVTNGIKNFSSYQWYRNDSLLKGETGYYIYIVPIILGSYTVEIKNSFGCYSAPSTPFMLSLTTGIKEYNGSGRIPIYPNPSSGNFIVENNSTENQILQVFDITGKLMLTQILQVGKSALDASNLSQGIYNVCISTDDQRILKKIVIIFH